eukprot:CAMPEP_0117537242 /NCGR_PEP_ID=MMETSP0784-20121206/41863_1 /TAXON_ID=39447 /ORGANISM="" /LENGTH=85 /DNA_ID=CAMNT_0005333821 /DNA_START=84 /DNA_END=341 /DNA_ORIENTATION=+
MTDHGRLSKEEACVTTEKARTMSEQQLRQELIELLSEHYSRRNMEMPASMHSATTEQLRRYWNVMRAVGTERPSEERRMSKSTSL